VAPISSSSSVAPSVAQNLPAVETVEDGTWNIARSNSGYGARYPEDTGVSTYQQSSYPYGSSYGQIIGSSSYQQPFYNAQTWEGSLSSYFEDLGNGETDTFLQAITTTSVKARMDWEIHWILVSFEYLAFADSDLSSIQSLPWIGVQGWKCIQNPVGRANRYQRNAALGFRACAFSFA
jgi:hypothetical protein